MKFSTAVILSSLSSVAAMDSIRGGVAAQKLLSQARRLDQNQQQGEFDYLGQYTLKMIHCASGETVYNQEDGMYDSNAVVVRLCPSENGCSDDATKGCKEGYGDFVVGLNSYVQAFMEDQRDNMNWVSNCLCICVCIPVSSYDRLMT